MKTGKRVFIACTGKRGHCEPMTSRLGPTIVFQEQAVSQSMAHVLVVGSLHREGVCSVKQFGNA